jgi:hypothetical protein
VVAAVEEEVEGVAVVDEGVVEDEEGEDGRKSPLLLLAVIMIAM